MAQREPNGAPPMALAAFEMLPEEDLYRVELVRGMVVRSPRPAALHGRLSVRLARRLDEFVEARGLGVVLADVGVVLARNPDTVRGPDVAFFSRGRIPENGYATTYWGAPDLAVEILSPSNGSGSVREKLAEYLAAGTLSVWVVDPVQRCVAVHGERMLHRFGGDDVLQDDAVLPGFRLPLRDLFAA